jgi:signal transduction histidine kinase
MGLRAPRALRTRLLLAIVVGVGLVLVLITAGFNVVVARSLSTDADDTVMTRASAELSALTIEGGRLVVPSDVIPATIDTRAWVFEGDTALRRPPVDRELDAEARALAGGPERLVDVPGNVRLYAVPVTSETGRRLGTVVAGVSLAPYDRTRVTALVASCALAAAALIAVALAAALILRAALRPVARMTADADAWSEGDLDSRFAVGPPHDEITRLASTFDGLLDRLAAGMRRERRLTAEVSHELRTPLAQIRAETDLALRRERTPAEYRSALEEVRDGIDRIDATVQTLLATARHDARLPRGTADVVEAASRVARACAPVAGETGILIAVTPSSPRARAGLEREVIERILHPVVENACRHARSRVGVAVSADQAGVSVTVRDDGPGVAPEDRERIFEPGVRGDGRPGRPSDGAGLGLSLSRRLARAAGGDVGAGDGPGGCFTVRLPSA